MQKELNHLLYESVIAAQEREAKAFDERAGNCSNGLILFGAGDLGRRTLAGLRKAGIEPLCFTDNRKELWNQEIDGMKLLSPEDAARSHPSAVFVLTVWSAHIGHPLGAVQDQLNSIREAKVVSFLYLYWKYPAIFLPYWRCDLPHKTIEQFELVSAAYSLWSDEASRKEYLGQVTWRVTGNSSKLTDPVKSDQYFPEDIFKLINKEVFVDIGAFDGDTLKVFLDKSSGNFRHYYAYEPDPFGYAKLKEFISGFACDLRQRVTVEGIGIGSHSETIEIESPGVYFKLLYPEETAKLVARVDGANATVPSKALDDLPFEHIPTYMKMDVEGFEPNVIFGAQDLIQKHNPIIAISVYHKYDHLWRLPLAVHALSNKYNFYLRPHCHAGWELICYAVPKQRTEPITVASAAS